MSQKKLHKLIAPDDDIVIEGVHLRPHIIETSETPFGFGIVEFGPGNVPFELNYDEALYCLEGSLSISNDETTIPLVAGESLWMGKNQKIVYEVPEAAKLVYVTHGAG